MHFERLGGLNWVELVLAVGVAAACGATIAGTPLPQALIFSGIATVAVAAYVAWWMGAASKPAVQEATAEAPRDADLARLSRLLKSADAELGHVTRLLRQAEASAQDHSRILCELGNLVLPRLQRAENQLQALLDARTPASTGSTADVAERRGHGGQALNTMRETAHLMEALLTLGRAEAETQPLRPERLDIRTSLTSLVGKRGELQIGLSVPTLVYCDRGLFSALVEQLLAQAENEQQSPRIAVDAEPRRGDMALLTIRFEGGLYDRPELAAAVQSGDAMRAAAVLLRDSGGEASLALPLALHAAARLGAKIVWQAEAQDQTAVLSLSLLMTVAPDRRLSERPMVLADLGMTQHTSG